MVWAHSFVADWPQSFGATCSEVHMMEQMTKGLGTPISSFRGMPLMTNCFLSFFLLFLRVSYYVAQASPELTEILPASASQVLELKMCTTIPSQGLTS